VSLSAGPAVTFSAKHFDLKLGAFFTEALTCYSIYEANLNKVCFRPAGAMAIEMPRRIWRVFAFAINGEHSIEIVIGANP
jgi:hypothetical protein